MAKLAILALALAAIVAFAEVSAHRTTITTTTVEDDEPQQYCSQELQSQQLDQCEMYMSQMTPSGDVLRMPVEKENPMRPPFQQYMPQCCEQLQKVDEMCQCGAIQRVFRNVQEQMFGPFWWLHGGEQMWQMAKMAENLPTTCELKSGKCPMIVPRI